MNKRAVMAVFLSALVLQACAPVTLPVNSKYQLQKFSTRHYPKAHRKISILVTLPEAAAAYQTEQMLYMQKPFELMPFANNAWVSDPANMLYPLLMQSLQHSGYFNAVSSTPYAENADYRLDTQLIKLHQNFMTRPSQIDFAVKVVLTRISDNKVIASQLINQRVSCLKNTPYGGVMAANQATERLTEAVTRFAVRYAK